MGKISLAKSSHFDGFRQAFYALAFISISLLIIFLRMHSYGEPLERDLTIYAYVAHQMSEGEKLYTTLWDNKPPGIYLTYMLAEFIWGYNPAAILYIGIIFTLISQLFVFLFMRKIADVGSALIASLFWATASNAIFLQANQPNTEVFLSTFTLIGVWGLSQQYSEQKSKYLFISGAAFAIASLYKINAIYLHIVLCFYIISVIPGKGSKDWMKSASAKLAMFLLPEAIIWSGVFSYFFFQDGLREFWDIVFISNFHLSQLSHSGILQNVMHFFSDPKLFFNTALREIWVLVVLSFFWIVTSQKKYGHLSRSFFVLFFFGVSVEVASPGLFHPHYYQLLVPVYSILSALFISDFAGRMRGTNMALKYGAMPIFIFALGCLFYFQAAYLKMTPLEMTHKKYETEYFDRSHDLAMIIKSKTGANDTIYEWGAEAGLYYYSQRKAASGIFHVYPLLFGPDDKKIQWNMRVYRDISSSPPALFIWNEKYGPLQGSMFCRFLLDNYRLSEKYYEYSIYERKDRNNR